jgi:hypothetical protein
LSPPSSGPKNKLFFIPDSRWFLALFIFRPWRWRLNVPPKLKLTFYRLHGVISQEGKLFMDNCY